ncbi:MAG: uroporphyrinogen-III C-methyltransferase, partial [Pirellulaceae bacterium]
MSGHVFLIGAGPGDPGLITVRGVQCLAQADVVLYDGLINPAILQHASHAELICVGKHGQQRIWTQAEIESEMLRWASQGKFVARLKGGDPAVFARAAEETEALTNANVSFEIVPGITAALAAGSYAGIPITHRRHASAVALVTGHQRDEDANLLDWDALARFPGTLVIYMGVTTVREWTSALIQGGKSIDTPAAIVRRCSWSDQQVVRCTLGEVA